MVKAQSIGDSLYQWLDRLADKSFRFWEIHKIGVLGTLSIHLMIAIALLAIKIKSTPANNKYDIEINFKNEYLPISEEEQKERLEIETAALAKTLREGMEASDIKNVAVDETKSNELNPTLQDDRGTNASDLYREAGRIKEQMNANKDLYRESLLKGTEEIPNTPDKNTSPAEEGKYKGPAVISYYLKGRKAIELPVPAYKCQFGGQVVVDIEVGQDGKVVRADIDSKNSITDECIDNAAIKAALESLFTVSSESVGKQKGSITYLFVPQ